MATTAPTISDILAARLVVNRYLPPTPIVRSPALDEHLGLDLTLKCENMQPVGAFKVRGGIYFMSRLDPEQRARGVVTASTGNHAQSIAYAAREFGVRAVIYMPEINNPDKVAATRRLGAEVVESGADFDACRDEAEAHARREGMRYIHPANEPWLLTGVGTYALELIEAAPDLDTVIVPVGGGSGVCGTAIVFKAMRPQTRIIAVQTRNMPAVYESFHQKQMISLEGGSTFAEGLATRVPFETPFRIMQELVDDVVLVSEEEMRQAMVLLLDKAHLVSEGAGAASLAAAGLLADDLRGQRVGLIVSGGNVTLDTLQRAMCDEAPWP
ncbi:MAG TPA: threonine/serine dehydratase [Thermomicrobiales bacterium]|nr:threonine ammonia-lyase [Chloroflexota bacterium]HBY45093.1 threonine ammonia-lyase [Chloroflexota bacterium]HQZ90143.1 threonine/serine dehydratase [Thermomicrobiales bacterium]HRA30656.1 threonine/serine dehydratase [Thermomicrobiales bacterium]